MPGTKPGNTGGPDLGEDKELNLGTLSLRCLSDDI